MKPTVVVTGRKINADIALALADSVNVIHKSPIEYIEKPSKKVWSNDDVRKNLLRGIKK